MNIRMSSLIRRCSLSIFGLVAITAICAQAQMADQVNADSAKLTYGKDSDTLSIDSGRPLMRAALILQALYGTVITYEDPKYSNTNDIVDIAPTTVRNYAAFRHGKEPKLVVPKSSAITTTVPKTIANPGELAEVLNSLIRLQGLQSHGGRFRILQTADMFHIIPAGVRDRDGNWAHRDSLLDTLISLPKEDRTETALYQAIADAVGSVAGVKLEVIVNSPIAFGHHSDIHTDIGASGETGRSVLTRALALHPTKRTWTLVHATEDGPNVFSLNVLDMPTDVAAVSY